jgi:hypothetical protein
MDNDAMLRETIARHFPEATVGADGVIALGFGGLEIACQVNAVRQTASVHSAHLYFSIGGGRLGAPPRFASVSGYGTSPEEAIVGGACNWACAFGPVLRAGLADEEQPEAETFEVSVAGQRFRVFVNHLDRALLIGDADGQAIKSARARVGGKWLTQIALESGRMPILAAERPTLASVFLSDGGKRIVEVKVDGVDWPGMEEAFGGSAENETGAIVMLRELAVVVPLGEAPVLRRDDVARTLAGLGDSRVRRASVDWPGWARHGGTLAQPIASDALVAAEAKIGEFPADYRNFLVEIGTGAGPGYGLFAPLGDTQATLAAGEFSWRDGEKPDGDPRGVVALAHAGCGVMWLLVLNGEHRGEVWIDGRSSDGEVGPVAPSFADWYRGWLHDAVRDVSFVQWDSRCCATAGVLSQILESFEREGIRGEELMAKLPDSISDGGVSLASSGSAYFAPGTGLNPCHGCIALITQFGFTPAIFQPAKEPLIGVPKRGLFSRLFGKER